jgi:hypothetical protein
MPSSASGPGPETARTNRFLAALRPHDYSLLALHLRVVGLERGEGAALERLAVRRATLKGVKPATEANFRVSRLEFGGVAEASHFRATNDDRMIDRIRENCIDTARRKDVRSQHCTGWIFRARECEQIREIG